MYTIEVEFNVKELPTNFSSSRFFKNIEKNIGECIGFGEEEGIYSYMWLIDSKKKVEEAVNLLFKRFFKRFKYINISIRMNK